MKKLLGTATVVAFLFAGASMADPREKFVEYMLAEYDRMAPQTFVSMFGVEPSAIPEATYAAFVDYNREMTEKAWTEVLETVSEEDVNKLTILMQSPEYQQATTLTLQVIDFTRRNVEADMTRNQPPAALMNVFVEVAKLGQPM